MKKSVVSDWQALSVLLEQGAPQLEPYFVYKACIAFAINGETHEAELTLAKEYSVLLSARRAIKVLNLPVTAALLENYPKLDVTHERYFELMGDREYLFGLLAHRMHDPETSEACFEQAAQLHAKGKDRHRALRSLINQKICRSTLASHVSGDLFFLKQRAFAEGYFDLVGNIEKAAACEWLCDGNFAEAERASQNAVAQYSIDGCPEDRSVAMTLYGISTFLMGHHEKAALLVGQVVIKNGKVASYLSILESLLAGKAPQLTEGHPLFPVQWPKMSKLKMNSIPGRIMQCLNESPMGRDQLIQSIWGENAIDPSYCGRLYTAIKDLRRKYGVSIEFDGQNYQISKSINRI